MVSMTALKPSSRGRRRRYAPRHLPLTANLSIAKMVQAWSIDFTSQSGTIRYSATAATHPTWLRDWPIAVGNYRPMAKRLDNIRTKSGCRSRMPIRRIASGWKATIDA